jgi:hypothetical protein
MCNRRVDLIFGVFALPLFFSGAIANAAGSLITAETSERRFTRSMADRSRGPDCPIDVHSLRPARINCLHTRGPFSKTVREPILY